MKIACVSDIHGKFGRQWPKADVLVIAGDIFGNYSGNQERDAFIQLQNFYEDFCPLLSSLKKQLYKDIVVVAGNHDRIFAYHQKACEDQLRRIGAHYLQDASAEIQGLKFYGSPWTPWFFGAHWVFNLSDKRSEEHAQETWNKIPDDTDVLITHGPPYGILDECPDFYLNNRSVGCSTLLDKVLEVKPRLHVFGHIHEGYGQMDTDNTIFVNAAVHDGDFKPTNPIRVVEI